MKTLKILIAFCFITGFLISSISQVNAQALVDKDFVYSENLYVTCMGQTETLVGAIHQHAVFLYDKNGEMKRLTLNYKGSYYSALWDEYFEVHGASNLNFAGDWILTRFYETLLLMGNKGTKLLYKTKFTVNSDGELEWELAFDKCF